MIPLSLPDWLAVVFVSHLALIFLITLYYSVRRYRHVPRHRVAPFVFRCTGCGHVYLDHRNIPMAECEKCGTMNESTRSF